MTVRDLMNNMELKAIAGMDGLDRPVTGGYCGDLLSWVMGRATAGDAWITVMGNLNSIAVAVLADVSCIILAEDSVADATAIERSNTEAIPILTSGKRQFDLAHTLANLLENEQGLSK